MMRYSILFLTHSVTIIKSEVFTFPIVVTFFRGCVRGVVVPSHAGSFLYIPGKLGFLTFITMSSCDMCK